MKPSRTLALGGILLLAVAAVFAQGMHHGGPDGHFHHMLEVFTNQLDLSSAQLDQVKAIWEKERPDMQALMKQMEQNHAQMRTLIEGGPYDEARVRALATSQAQTTIEMEVQHARVKAAMLQVLNPDQKAKLAQIESKHEARMADRVGPPPED